MYNERERKSRRVGLSKRSGLLSKGNVKSLSFQPKKPTMVDSEEEIGELIEDEPTPITKNDVRAMTREYKSMASELPKLEIERMVFSIVSDEFLRGKKGKFGEDDIPGNAIAITDPSTEKGVMGGVNDPRLGPIDEYSICSTCHQGIESCSGQHLGYIPLAVPIIHPSYRKELGMVLQSVCNCCSRLIPSKDTLIQKGILNLTGTDRLKAIAEVAADLPCTYKHQYKDKNFENTKNCEKNPYYILSQIETTGKLVWARDKKNKKTAEGTRPLKSIGKMPKVIGALEILSVISDEDLEILGYIKPAHPKNYILLSFPVISPIFRQPSIVNGEEHLDQLTEIYKEIVEVNNQLQLKPKDSNKLEDELIFIIQHLIDNVDQAYPKGARSRKTISIKQKLQSGKENRIRKEMLGKRVNFAGRAVITGNPNQSLTTITIPETMARILTKPERVNSSNIYKLTALLLLGWVKQVNMRNLEYYPELKQRLLKVGDMVIRSLLKGDRVVINRQPTLSSESIMAQKIKIGRDATIQIHPGITTPYNADFDGDEMNIHVPQSEEAEKEAETVLATENCLTSTRDSRNTIGVIQDALVGAYRMTVNGHKLFPIEQYTSITIDIRFGSDRSSGKISDEQLDTYEDFLNRLEKHGINPRSGYGIISLCFPRDFSYIKDKMRIIDGIMIDGTLKKEHLGSTRYSIIQAIKKQYGELRSLQFLDDIYSICNKYMLQSGFSVGIMDCKIPVDASISTKEEKEVLAQYEKLLEYPNTEAVKLAIIEKYRQLKKAGLWTDNVHTNLSKLIALMPISTLNNTNYHPDVRKAIAKAYMIVEASGTTVKNPIEADRREKQIQEQLSLTEGVGTKLTNEHPDLTNPFVVMALSGAKGGARNTALISAIVGQQYMSTGRIPQKLNGGRRVLAYDDFEDNNPETRGFITNSYSQGLTQRQFFLVMLPSRESLVSTANSTQETGTINRKMTRDLQDISVRFDGTVRFKDAIIQYAYGYTGFDIRELETVSQNSEESFSYFINLKNRANYYNDKFGYGLTGPLPLLPFEQTIIHNNRQAYIIDVGIRKVRLQYLDDSTTDLVNIDQINRGTIDSLNNLPPRKYYRSPITSLLPVSSRVLIDNGQHPEPIPGKIIGFEDNFVKVATNAGVKFIWHNYIKLPTVQSSITLNEQTGIVTAVSPKYIEVTFNDNDIQQLSITQVPITIEYGYRPAMVRSYTIDGIYVDYIDQKIDDIINPILGKNFDLIPLSKINFDTATTEPIHL